jgi:hypothetical protein
MIGGVYWNSGAISTPGPGSPGDPPQVSIATASGFPPHGPSTRLGWAMRPRSAMAAPSMSVADQPSNGVPS